MGGNPQPMATRGWDEQAASLEKFVAAASSPHGPLEPASQGSDEQNPRNPNCYEAFINPKQSEFTFRGLIKIFSRRSRGIEIAFFSRGQAEKKPQPKFNSIVPPRRRSPLPGPPFTPPSYP
jgi:hypothetical protein